MIIQPERGTRNINEKFYEMEMRQIAMLNEIFGEVELTKGEMQTLVWLAGWEESTVANVVSAMRKAIAAETSGWNSRSVHRTDKLPAGRKGSF